MGRPWASSAAQSGCAVASAALSRLMSILASTCRPSARAAAARSAPSPGMMTPSAGNRFQYARHQAVLYRFWPANGVTYNQREAAVAATVPGAMCSIPQSRERSSSWFGVSVSADAAGKNRSSRNAVLSGLLSGLGQEAVHLQPLLDAIQITVRATAFRDETVGTHLEYVKFRLQAGFDPGAEQVD